MKYLRKLLALMTALSLLITPVTAFGESDFAIDDIAAELSTDLLEGVDDSLDDDLLSDDMGVPPQEILSLDDDTSGVDDAQNTIDAQDAGDMRDEDDIQGALDVPEDNTVDDELSLPVETGDDTGTDAESGEDGTAVENETDDVDEGNGEETEICSENDDADIPDDADAIDGEEGDPEEVPFLTSSAYLDEDPDDADALFDAYALEMFGIYDDGALYEPRNLGGELTGDVRTAYDLLKPWIKDVANGRVSSTIVELEMTFVLYGTQQQKQAQFNEKINELFCALLYDYPLELYWFDKTRGFYVQQKYVNLFQFGFSVNKEFSAGSYKVDTVKTVAARTAARNVRSIVNEYANYSDYAKLKAYKEKICNLTSYNSAAANGTGTWKTTGYGNPWQLIWVFDGNPNTNVVCEGYSKAFQYLCDISNFRGDVCCYCVTGDMQGSGHMWNVVRMPNGKRYMVDLTNCDTGAYGAPDYLFLKAPESGSASEGYTFRGIGWMRAEYTYDAETESAYQPSDLTLSDNDYLTESSEPDGVIITDVKFPYTPFRNYIAQSFDTNGDGKLSDDEIEDVVELDFASFTSNSNSSETPSVKGVEYFIALRKLKIRGLNLDELDLSRNTALQELDCSSNDLRDIEFCLGQNLVKLECAENRIDHLDLHLAPNLQILDCSTNALTALDLSAVSGLASLDCSGNALTALDLSVVPLLTSLDCSGNALTTLDLSAVASLTALDCSGNALTALDLSAVASLTALNCSGNKLTELNLSPVPFMAKLDCSGNSITRLNISACGALMDAFQSVSPVLSGNVYEYKNADQDHVLRVDTGTRVVDEPEIKITDESFPDNVFRAYVMNSLDPDRDGYLIQSEWESVNGIDVSGNSIRNLTGIERFPNLKTLNCSETRIKTLNLASNPALTILDCSDARLTRLDLSGNSNLVELNCSGNEIRMLNLSAASGIRQVKCALNDMIALTLGTANALVWLDCADNALSALEIQSCANLETLDCSNNALSALNVAGASASLLRLNCSDNNLSGIAGLGECSKLQELDCAYNTALSELNPNGSSLKTLKADHCALTSLTLSACPVSAISVDHNKLTALSLPNCAALTTLACEYNRISTLKLQGDCSLKTLTCQHNSLTQLNIADCASLEHVDCAYNQLKAVDDGNGISGLLEFCIRNNRMTAFDLNAPNLKKLDCANNRIAELYAANLSTLQSLDCSGNSLTALDVSNCSKLQSLRCARNKIVGLVLPDTNANALAMLDCSGNRLTALNTIGEYGSLRRLHCQSNLISALNITGLFNIIPHTMEMNLDDNPFYWIFYAFGEMGEFDETEIDDPSEEDGLPVLIVDKSVSVTGAGMILDPSGNGQTVEQVFHYSEIQDGFADVLWDFDADGDGWLSNAEISMIRELEIIDRPDVTTLGGIENLTSLECLCIENTGITEVAIAGMPRLNALSCQNIKGFNVAGCPNLESVVVDFDRGNNSFTLTRCPNLDALLVSNSDITSLSLSEFIHLTSLECADNALETLDVSSCRMLETLDCSSNALTGLTLGACTRLERLECSDNHLTALNLAPALKLEYLDCSLNDLTVLNLSGHRAISSLICNDNPLATLLLSGCSALKKLMDSGVAIETDYNLYTDGSEDIFSNCLAFDFNVTPAFRSELAVLKNRSAKVNIGADLQITLGGKKAKSFKSSNTKVATVGKTNGIVTPKKAGKAKITIMVKQSAKKTVKRVLTLTVVDPLKPTSVRLTALTDTTGLHNTSAKKTTLFLGHPMTVDVSLSPATAVSNVTWKSSNTKIAKVKKYGSVEDGWRTVITPVKTGKAKITATTARGGRKKTFTIVVKDPNLPRSISLDQTSVTQYTSGLQPFTLTPALTWMYGDELSTAKKRGITWSSSNKKIATVRKDGTVTPLKAGTVTITAKTVNGKKAVCKLTIRKNWLNGINKSPSKARISSVKKGSQAILKSVEIASGGRIVAEWYVMNGSKKTYSATAGLTTRLFCAYNGGEPTPIALKQQSGFRVNVPAKSCKVIKITYAADEILHDDFIDWILPQRAGSIVLSGEWQDITQ